MPFLDLETETVVFVRRYNWEFFFSSASHRRTRCRFDSATENVLFFLATETAMFLGLALKSSFLWTLQQPTLGLGPALPGIMRWTLHTVILLYHI